MQIHRIPANTEYVCDEYDDDSGGLTEFSDNRRTKRKTGNEATHTAHSGLLHYAKVCNPNLAMHPCLGCFAMRRLIRHRPHSFQANAFDELQRSPPVNATLTVKNPFHRRHILVISYITWKIHTERVHFGCMLEWMKDGVAWDCDSLLYSEYVDKPETLFTTSLLY